MIIQELKPTYLEFFREVKMLGNPKTIIVDFEVGAIEALTTTFPNSKIRGCWFHLNQSILRKGFQGRYQNDKSFARFIKLFAALAVVPPKDALRRFRQFMRTIRAELELRALGVVLQTYVHWHFSISTFVSNHFLERSCTSVGRDT